MHAGQDPGDEKSQIQALDRTAPILPLRLGPARTSGFHRRWDSVGKTTSKLGLSAIVQKIVLVSERYDLLLLHNDLHNL